jgi:hypothetical protein
MATGLLGPVEITPGNGIIPDIFYCPMMIKSIHLERESNKSRI